MHHSCELMAHPVTSGLEYLATALHRAGLAYIETMNLDGETNLKIKKALDVTKDLGQDGVSRLRLRVECEPPNSRLYTFTGNMYLEGRNEAIPLSPACMLLR